MKLPTNFKSNLYTAVKSAEVTLTLLDRCAIPLDLNDEPQTEIYLKLSELVKKTREGLQEICDKVEDVN